MCASICCLKFESLVLKGLNNGTSILIALTKRDMVARPPNSCDFNESYMKEAHLITTPTKLHHVIFILKSKFIFVILFLFM